MTLSPSISRIPNSWYPYGKTENSSLPSNGSLNTKANGIRCILRIDTLCLEGICRQKLMRFSQLIFWPTNRPQVRQNIVSFGLHSSSMRGKDGQISMIKGLLHSSKKRKSDAYSLALPPKGGCNYCTTC